MAGMDGLYARLQKWEKEKVVGKDTKPIEGEILHFNILLNILLFKELQGTDTDFQRATGYCSIPIQTRRMDKG
jgi:hypothetical protein